MANYRVLIIDDAFFIRNLIKKAIAKKPQTKGNTFEVVGEAQDGRAGLDLCESLQPDIITVDFNIPTINGLDFAKYLKELHPDIPVIMISSNLDPDFAARVAAAQCRLLTKPFQEAYLWKILDEAVDEILNMDKTAIAPKVNEEAKKILAELEEEMKGEIVPLKDTRKDISSKGLADKNIKQEKAKNVGFDYSGEVLEIQTGRRRMSAEMLENPPEQPIEPEIIEPEIVETEVTETKLPEITFSQIDEDVDLHDEDDDFFIDLDAVENQRESEYGKTGIEELDDEEFIFIADDEDDEPVSEENPVQENPVQYEPKEEVLKLEDLVPIVPDMFEEDEDDEDDDIFLIDDGDAEEAVPVVAVSAAHEELLTTVTFHYYDYLGGLIYSVQNSAKKQEQQVKPEIKVEEPEKVIREETVDEEFERMFNEFNGVDIQFDNESSIPSNNTQKRQEEQILSRTREHVSVDPPKDDSILKIYGSKLKDVTSSETFEQLNAKEQETDIPVKKKGFFARLLDKIFGRS